MRKFIGVVIVLSLITIVSNGCYFDKEDVLYPSGVCDTADVKYSNQINYIISNKCYDCHSNSSSAISGSDVSLEGYANISGYLSTNATTLINSVKHVVGYTPMPKDRPMLSSCEVATIEIWVENGYPNN